MIRNKKGHLDARDAIGLWSFIKFFGDTILILAGGGIFLSAPSVETFSLAFVLWTWALIKEVFDLPLVFLWAIGKIGHLRRKRLREAKARKRRQNK